MPRLACHPPPSPTTISFFLNGCQNPRELKQIHAQILTNPTLHYHSTTALLFPRLLLLCSSIASASHYASSLFLCIPSPTLSSYNAILRSLSTSPPPSSSPLNPISVYSRLLFSPLLPNQLTFPFLFKHCSLHLGTASATGKSLHSHVFKLGFHSDVFIQNAIVYFYSSCGCVDSARKLFDEMSRRDVVSWNSLLVGYLRCGMLDEAMASFRRMEEKNIVTWNSIITGFVQGGRSKEALGLFHELQMLPDGSVRPDKITIASVVSACSSLGALEQGRWVHGYLQRNRLELDVVVGTALIDMYGKCGCLARAAEVFEEMPRKDVLAWTAMISAFAAHGLANEAFSLLEEMERCGTKPNRVTFGALLSACAHSGMVEKGRQCFNAMKRVYAIEPQQQHYACMVDLLGRAGLFDEAMRLIGSMTMEPDVFVWGAFLGACRMHGNVELGERVADHLIGLDPLNHAFYIVLSDIYAKAKRFYDAKKVWNFMKDQGIKKTVPGCSMIEVDGKVHEFSAKRAQDGVTVDILRVLTWISDELKCDRSLPANNELLWEG